MAVRTKDRQQSALHVAFRFGQIGAVRALLAAGARADLRDIDGLTPLDLVPSALRAEVERLVQQAKEERENNINK